ncbi:MAG TPA: hypothetical protein VFN09_11160 [Rhodanobacteraceae bacterium]|nr:hypothetical protein [Rhodanobacteraceae bacterium]
MTRKTETEPMLRGRAKHRRTQSDYMGALLDRVTLETWGDVIDATVAKAKDGDAQARAFLAAYLVGKPAHDAPAPLAVTAARINGDDALVDKLADKVVRRQLLGGSSFDVARDDAVQSITAELPEHIEP